MTINEHNIDVIIPTYKPDERFIRCLELLGKQTRPVSHIQIVNTGREQYDLFMKDHSIPASVRTIVSVIHITPEEFDHGKTRNEAVLRSDSGFFIMMTQDALPCDETLVENLISPLELDPGIAVSYARQLPAPGASETEKYVRGFNYPDKPLVKSKEDINTLGVKTFFCSNVCAAYRRSAYDEAGGFIEKTIFNEDMILAAGLIKKGYSISYTADARVYHSHNYTCKQQFKRNFDLAVSQTDHPEVFSGISSESEGIRMVKGCISHLVSIHKPYLIPGFIMNCASRLLGFKLGKIYRVIPNGIRKILSSQPGYWTK
ncbi:MAG: glycosyltransferase family 2 protein [Lachnospiraceae bacterium]|nr:glycosyltransferase family 2 protein [Lachnospiraceae bacterium]